MKLASLKQGRDGSLVVVDKGFQNAVKVPEIAASLVQALENWALAEPKLKSVSDSLNSGKANGAFKLNLKELVAVLPRAPQFVDGSAYLAHVERVRKARGAEMPPSFQHDPLMYHAVSDGFLAPTEPIRMASEDYGIDFESEVGVVVDDVPMGVTPADAAKHIKLLLLINDVSLRNLIPDELAKGFGFLQSKPRSALSPLALTPDELGSAWQEGKLHLPLITHLNGALFGEPDAGVDMQFNFPQLIAHAAKTRPLAAGSIVGSGTIANQDESKGSSCLAEKRVLEIIKSGKAVTPFMKFGDRVRIEMLDKAGVTLFGAIEQVVEKY